MRAYAGLALVLALSVQAQNPAITIPVDANANVYGVAYGTTAQLLDLNVQ